MRYLEGLFISGMDPKDTQSPEIAFQPSQARVLELRSPETIRRSPRLEALARSRGSPAPPTLGASPIRRGPRGRGRTLTYDSPPLEDSTQPEVGFSRFGTSPQRFTVPYSVVPDEINEDSLNSTDSVSHSIKLFADRYVDLENFGVFDYPEGAHDILMEYFAASSTTIFELDEVQEAIVEVEQELQDDSVGHGEADRDGQGGPGVGGVEPDESERDRGVVSCQDERDDDVDDREDDNVRDAGGGGGWQRWQRRRRGTK